jgi:hypothetical protein
MLSLPNLGTLIYWRGIAGGIAQRSLSTHAMEIVYLERNAARYLKAGQLSRRTRPDSDDKSELAPWNKQTGCRLDFSSNNSFRLSGALKLRRLDRQAWVVMT